MSYAFDNHAPGFPARMSDGRQFTDFRSNCIMNNNVSMKSTSWLLRQDLIQNAISYMDNNTAIVENKNKCTSCFDNTVLPIKNYQQCQPTGCTYSENTGYGIGYDRI
tara:strand:- start:882 stop:1202 length:321 start_codon:yes stop_codon:yes gene_type:complete